MRARQLTHSAFIQVQLVTSTFTHRAHAGVKYYHVEVPFEAWYDRRAFERLPGKLLLYHEFAAECGAPGVLDEVGANTHTPFTALNMR
jgi:hypothetical protein